MSYKIPFSIRMLYLSTIAYSIIPEGPLTDWSVVKKLLKEKEKKKENVHKITHSQSILEL